MALTSAAARLGEAVGAKALGSLMDKVVGSASNRLVRDVQNILGKSSLVGNILGISTGISALDSVLGLGPDDGEKSLLGGFTYAQAKAIHRQCMQLQTAQKNLYFVRIWDESPPIGDYGLESVPNGSSLMQQGISRLGAAAGQITNGIASSVTSIAGPMVGNAALGLMNGFMGGLGLGSAGTGIAGAARDTLDLLCVDVQYSKSINGDSVNLGGTFYDAPSGASATEITLVTMDDEAGTLKRWFEGKRQQVAAIDGTMGVPAEYSVGIEIVHAIPGPEVKGVSGAYKQYFNMRAVSISSELSRRDQQWEELPMTFIQIDPFMG